MQIVSQIISETKSELKTFFQKRCQKKISRLERKKFGEKKIICPHCKNQAIFIRKGKRARTIRTSEGDVTFLVQQISCTLCKRMHRPLIAWLELQARQVITEELLDKGIAVAIHTSYKVASHLTKTFTGKGVGGKSIRAKMLCKAEEIRQNQANEPPKDYVVILEDSTKGKTGLTKRGEDIHVAYGITGRKLRINKETGEVKRQLLTGDILYVSVGEYPPERIQHRTKGVMTDGAGGVQKKRKYGESTDELMYYRCLWHLSRMLGFALYNDGLKTKKERRYYVSKLAVIIKYSFRNYKKYYRELMAALREKELYKSEKYLENAEQEFYNVKENPPMIDGIPLLATSPIERVMREIDRRVDNGARWSRKGLEAITRVRLNYLYN